MGTGVRRKLTDEQRRAIAARDVSVALSAGAGCGKTFVLTERFLAELDPGARDAAALGESPLALGDGRPRLGELVAITFTERAAREMRDRIRAACRWRLLGAPEEQVDYWLHLLRELDAARISTIHSFSAALLRSHPVEAGIDPQFRVLDQAQADTLLHEMIDDCLRQRLAAQEEAVIDLVVEFGLEAFRGMLASLLRRRQEIDWTAWRAVTPDGLVGRWEAFRREVTLPNVAQAIARGPDAQTLLRIAPRHPPDDPTMHERCEILLARLPRLGESTDPVADLDAIEQNARVQGAKRKTAWSDQALYDEFREAANRLREAIRKIEPVVAFDPASARPAAELGLRVLGVARGVAEAYEARKQELGALDFDDLVVRTRALLTDPENGPLRRRIASQIRLLLVDEFQDTDPGQVELVRALCGGIRDRGRGAADLPDASSSPPAPAPDVMLAGGKLFFVGDYKQSIYRFRGADPQVFRRLRQATPAEGRLPLTLNFRSQPAILHFVNALFCDDLGPDYQPLRAQRRQVSAEPAVELLWAPDPLPGQRSGQAERIRRQEADWIARRLRGMLEGGERIVGDREAAEGNQPCTRPVRPGDVALLFRALSDVQYYEEALRRYGIDYYLVGGHAFYAQQEIFDLLNLLRALASPCDEVSLAGALRSPMFGLEDETLFWLAREPGGLSAGLSAADTPEPLSQAQRRRVEFARSTLARLRSKKDRLPIADLLQDAFSQTGYDAVVLAEFLGERKLANLKKLVDQARSFDRSGIFSLSDFIRQLSEFVARQPDEPLAATCPESVDVVRLMTIHQAKGLEFPVVVVPDVDRRMQSRRGSVAFSPQLGPMVKTSTPSGLELHAATEMEKELAELVRLLYVAMTRAADYLILSGGVRCLGSARGPWTELIYRRFDPTTGELRAALGAGCPKPKIKVTTSEPPEARKASAARAPPNLGNLAATAARMAARGSGRVPPHLGPVAPDPAARRHYSFSRLAGSFHALSAAPELTALEEAGEPSTAALALDPLGLGTLVHDVLAEIDWNRPEDAATLIRRAWPRHLADEKAGFEDAVRMVRGFLGSPRAAQLAAAGEVYRELEFLLAWPPGNRQPGSPYLQGFIDCLYRDSAGRWILLDYKTNTVTASTVEATAAEYEMQMLLYALAAERILGAPCAELALCFLRPGLEHVFRWDERVRNHAVELLNEALDSYGNRMS